MIIKRVISKSYIIATTTLLAASLSASPARTEPVPTTMPEAKRAFKLSGEWISGKLADYRAPKVTYSGEPITLRASMHTPAVAGLTKFNAKAMKILEKMSGGKIKVKFRPGGVVHNVREGFDANRNDITDMSPCFVFYNPTNFPLLQGLGLPGLFPNAGVMQKVAEQIYRKYFAAEFERQGVYALGFVGSPQFHLFTKAPIITLGEMKGKKVRSGGGINQRIFQALGASTVNMSSRDFQQGLQRGLIDAVFTSNSAGMIFKLTGVAKHHTEVAINHVQLDWCMNKKSFDKLPPDLKRVVNHWARAKFQAETQQAFLRLAVIARGRFTKAGMKFHKLGPAEKARWQKAYANVTSNYLADMDKRGLPARQMIAEIKQLVAKYKDMTFNQLMRDAIDNPAADFSTGVK
jgi:TRAP-type C4-dicarboxylate transport system substrate-binding protein